MSETSILYPPLPLSQLRSKHFQKNCSECTRSHRRCIFMSPDQPKCTRCTKMHLLCCFVPSSELIYCHVNVLISFFNVLFIFPNMFRSRLPEWYHPEEVTRTSSPPSLSSHPFGGGLRSDNCQSTLGISERIHYPPWFTIVALGGLAAALLPCHMIVRLYNHLPLMMLVTPQVYGPT